MKKRFLAFAALCLVLGTSLYAGGRKDGRVLTIGATPVPHAELLNLIRDDLAAEGVELRIREFNDYVQPNEALIAGDLDANFFQHQPYLESNDHWKTLLVSAFGVHVEPLGLYTARDSNYKSLDQLPVGAEIGIPNDPTNGGRALLLLQANNLIALNPEAGLTATPQDVVSNVKEFKFRELEAAQLPRSLGDLQGAIINGNYALQSGFNPVRDSLIIEGAESPYVNVVVVKRGNEKDKKIQALAKALRSQKVKDYITANYNGGVVAVF